MGHFEEIQIDRSEGWKYQTTLDNSKDGYRAKVWVDDDGKISKESYSRKYNEKCSKSDKSEKSDKKSKAKGNKGKDIKKKEGWLTKLWKAPFRLLWWLVKQVLIILSLGILNNWLNKK